jgi:hypothetical protein
MDNTSVLQVKDKIHGGGEDNATMEQLMNKLIDGLMISLPEQLDRYESDPVELHMINSEFIDEIINHANEEIGMYLNSRYAYDYLPGYSYTLRDLFLYTIIRKDIWFKEKKSYDILDRLIDASGNNNSFAGIGKPTEIKLSVLMGHRFDSEVYSFNLTHITKLVMRSENIPFFRRVVRMMRYLSRKLVLYINYPQYYECHEGIPLVVPYPLDKLHRTSTKNCAYYSNFWDGVMENKSEHSNAIMAILSFLKYCMERNKT